MDSIKDIKKDYMNILSSYIVEKFSNFIGNTNELIRESLASSLAILVKTSNSFIEFSENFQKEETKEKKLNEKFFKMFLQLLYDPSLAVKKSILNVKYFYFCILFLICTF